MNLNNYIKDNRNGDITPVVVCNDGLELSIQASGYHYCSPRDNVGPYFTIEIGFPSEEIESIIDYAEDPTNPTDTIYAQVPVTIVEDIIELHGGIKS